MVLDVQYIVCSWLLSFCQLNWVEENIEENDDEKLCEEHNSNTIGEME